MAMMRKEHRSPFNEDACDPAAHGAWGVTARENAAV
jgi:hypothetical protein